MTGAKIPVLEIENLFFSEDGRGLVLRNDASNLVVQSGSPWTGLNASGGVAHHDKKTFLSTGSAIGWLKVRYISGSTYGATGAAAYVPIFTKLDTRTA